jgi:hypothetical protein
MSKDHFADLHHHAFQIYDDELKKRDHHGIRLSLSHVPRPRYTIEALYHYVNYLLLSNLDRYDKDDLISTFLTYIKLFSLSCNEVSESIVMNVNALKDAWETDDELHELVQKLPDGDDLLIELNGIF